MDHPINSEDYEDIDIDDPDNPELSAEDFARARPFKEVFPDIYEKMVREQADVTPAAKKA